MSAFSDILKAPPEELIRKVALALRGVDTASRDPLSVFSRHHGLNLTQTICALGFNPHVGEVPEVLGQLGYPDYKKLADERNRRFIDDVYDKLTIGNVLKIYEVVAAAPEMLEVMQYLMISRLEHIEERIEQTVNSLVIDRYKREVRAIYKQGIATIEFAESRLDRTDSGFRALINEVGIIVDSRLIPIGDIFFRDTVLPEEKRRLIQRGQIPRELILSRLDDDGISAQERAMLEQSLQLVDD
ncbi:MAG: hypothetical protein D6786_06035 [Gammaproteobacteria bacterium]|nr:MAG: hypothetical protein D6786_06035 [Gammaproteobacteria bacterium]